MPGTPMPYSPVTFDNIRWIEVKLNSAPGKHRLKVIMVDPEIVVEQIVVNPDNNHYSYFGAGNK